MDIIDPPNTNVHCFTCDKSARSNAYLYRCHNCDSYYDKACGKFTTSVQENGTSIRTCVGCVARLKNATSNDKPVITRVNSAAHGNASSDSTKDSSTAQDLLTTQSPSDTHEISTGLLAFMEEMRKMNSDLSKKITNMNSSVQDRLDNFSEKLEVLESIPALAKRVDDAEAEIESVKNQLTELKQQLDLALKSGSTTSLPRDVTGKISSLEKQSAELMEKIQGLSTGATEGGGNFTSRNAQTLQLTTEVVIGGLAVQKETRADLKQLSAAAIKVVYPNLDKRDIISARYLIRRSTIGPTTDESAADSGRGSTSAVTVGTTVTPGSQLHSTSPPSIVVALSSRALLLEVLRSKARLGKLHTTACGPHLPAEIKASSLIPGLVNFHEYLPGPVFKVHNFVRRKAKELRENSKPGFIHFISNGKIYVRRMKGQPSVLITSEKDLEDFLSS